MRLIEGLNALEKRYAWSLFGFGLAIFFGFITIYTEFIRDPRPKLNFEVISDASVLDVREKLGDLEILYGGLDIQKAQKSLRVIVVRITNDGTGDIRHYDDTSPFGFRILKGTLLRAEVLSTSNPYLRQTLQIQLREPDTALINPVILEARESFTVKSLIVHAEGVRPEIEPIGKIAGVREIYKTDSADLSAEPSFLARTFSGTAGVQLARVIVYFFAMLSLLIAIIVPSSSAGHAIAKRRRRKHVSQFKTHTKLALTEKDEFIFERYIQSDMRYLRRLQQVPINERRLTNRVTQHEKRMHRLRTDPEYLGAFHQSPALQLRTISYSPWPIEDMQSDGFIVNTDGKWHVDPHLKQTLDEFIRFLEIKRAA